MTKISLAATIAFTLALPIFAKPFSESLTPEQFEQAGLGKLSPQELRTLDQLWQAAQVGTIEPKTDTLPESPTAPTPPAPVPALAATPSPATSATPAPNPEDLLGKEQITPDVSKAPKEIRSRLVGTFNGWYGETKFQLENGQIWQQRIEDVQKYTPSESPEVTVKKAFGGYRLVIDGYRQSCPVKRIK
ncbi:hypothetical protein [Pelagicoccus albus]|uniref:Uncharacterized protein n=1 Tax=Pelagicoccus albus TaxID=415222 RepID=A0A7X1E9K5_9BACT|nr:hypothetical protein [Pelagicoccus albus]MBC2607431.1 hypothetical protein [Pelagicoccus albus]